MDLIYLDYNCFQRGFDDPLQTRIQMEALACQEIFIRAEFSKVKLAWSFMHQDETILCPFPERKYAVFGLANLCQVRIPPLDEIYQLAISFQSAQKFSPNDAIHLACAVHIQADFFLTCDDNLRKKAERMNLSTIIINPIDYIRKEEN